MVIPFLLVERFGADGETCLELANAYLLTVKSEIRVAFILALLILSKVPSEPISFFQDAIEIYIYG